MKAFCSSLAFGHDLSLIHIYYLFKTTKRSPMVIPVITKL